MIVSLDQVNALAKSKYKNYMITVQSADSMMLSDLAEEEDILATSIPNPIERFFTFLTLEVRDTEVDKAMLEMRITLAKEDKIKGTGRSAALAKKDKSEKSAIHDNFIEVCRSLSDDLTKSAKTLCETKYYKNTQFDVGSRIAFIDELNLNNSNFPDYLIFTLNKLNVILSESLGINLRLAVLAKDNIHCPFDKNINKVLNQADLVTTHNTLENSLSAASNSNTLLPEFFDNFSIEKVKDGRNVYDLNKFISSITKTDSGTGQMADMTNIMSSLEKANKVTANISSQSITDALVSVQDLQNGRLDPIDSPESSKIGIVHHRTILTKNDDDGNLLVPFIPVKDGEVVSDKPVYLTAVEEKDQYIAEWCETFKNGDGSKKQRVLARYCGNVLTVDTHLVTYKEYSPLATMSPARSCIPFQNHSNGKRLLMSCNHHKQAVPTFGACRARVGTGCESILDTGNYTAKDLLEDFYDCNSQMFPEIKNHKEEILNSDLKLLSIDVGRGTKTLLLKVMAMEKLGDKFPQTTKLLVPFAQKTTEKNMFS